MKLLNSASRDRVTALLGSLAVRSSVYCLSELDAPWGFEVDGANVAKFHLVLDGSCWLQADGQQPLQLGPGDLVILPLGDRHAITDDLRAPDTSLQQLIADHPLDSGLRLRCGGEGARTTLLCGGFALRDPIPGHLLALLPPVLKTDSRGADVASWISPVFEMIREEARHNRPGAQAIFTRLADVILIQALRAHLAGGLDDMASRSGMRPDPRIERAAALLRDQPGRPWSLQSLAHEVGMSRTSLAAGFRAATGESPMRHLARTRLSQAAGYLLSADLSIEAIAKRTGYASSASLSKAFRREFGSPPGAYREMADVAAAEASRPAAS